MDIIRFIFWRLLQSVPVLLGVSIITFILMAATPGDPIRLLVGDRATPELIATVRDRYGLDDPILSQYFTYLKNLLVGDLGASLRYRVPVSQLIAQHYPVTLFLVLYTIVLTLPPVVLLSVWSARRQNGIADQLIRILGIFGLAVPVFWLALLLARFFGVTLGWLPVSGFGETFGEHILHLFLPALSTTIWVVPILVRTLRSALLDEISSDYVVTGLSKGLGERQVFRTHVFPNSILPTLNLFAVIVAYLLGGSVIVETVYAVPGMGKLMVDSILARDYFVVQGATLVFALTTIIVMLTVDLLSALIDPRVTP
ncbi:ABC transporter permease [Sulfitobacter mediterraneus]|uniref:ABC transporter permease n=1 Tax=Sulfitobacter mediterraneus TaxID=83219 RepID=UPI001933EE20|nr:ABC transporter permease [Sulfitobacter mediterraneus]MBM1635177.1 ABC transporter permease [Sulfitobacter mediterraneus]MBM1643028.1 ABC transporter permease [Sulfitobacter mediterraneus]MBM1647076.1 ABC transporter permease [Sulfitobacter mediterraneus]MBM1651118.1 ABC transporter permease [Sulfitobacter mediterraneus]MBM1655155.1 ABC transporter permease [Sulfitobacter mediterraneus]